VQVAVDGLGQAASLGEHVEGPDAAAGDPATPIAEFIVDVAGGEDGPAAISSGDILEPFVNSALAFGQPFSCSLVHSKSLSLVDPNPFGNLRLTENQRDFEPFSRRGAAKPFRVRLRKG
jgi:hypothetical protein